MSVTPQRQAAELLWSHWRAGTTLAALPAAWRPADRAAGYAVQACLPDVMGDTVAGWKIAATSAGGQAHIGVSGPLAGRLPTGRQHRPGTRLSLGPNRMRVAEPEFAFVLGIDLAPRNRPYTVDEVVAAAASLHPGIEVPDSRYQDFVGAGEAQLLADDACADRYVLGEAAAVDWRALDLPAHRVHARVTGPGGERYTREGQGAAVLGDPRVALAWLVNEVTAIGVTLRAGQFVTTGTCMVPLELEPGDTVAADYGVLGRIEVGFDA